MTRLSGVCRSQGKAAWRPVDHALEIDVYDKGVAHRIDALEIADAENAGVVEQYVEAAVMTGEMVQCLREGIGIGDIQYVTACAGPQFRNQTLDASGIHIVNTDLPASCMEQPRGFATNARGGSGDEDGLGPHGAPLSDSLVRLHSKQTFAGAPLKRSRYILTSLCVHIRTRRAGA